MYKKSKCKKCKYHGQLQGSLIYCNYAAITGRTCLKREHKDIIDQRKGEANECLYYEKGVPTKQPLQIHL